MKIRLDIVLAIVVILLCLVLGYFIALSMV